MHTATLQTERSRVHLLWLLRLRWFAFLGQIVTIGVAIHFFHLELDAPALWTLALLFGGSNGLATRWQHLTLPFSLEGAILLLDTAFLTTLLYFSGGPANPFSALYLVHIVLALMILSERWAWGLTVFTLSCFGFLFFFHREIPHLHSHENMNAHFQGMWVAMGITSTIIVYFVRRILQSFSQIEHQLEESKEALVRQEKLRSLGTLAAGAAHELSTPLSTIALISHELLQRPEFSHGKSDLALIRSEVERCKSILSRFSANLGHPQGEHWVDVVLCEFVRTLEGASSLSLTLPSDLASRTVRFPIEAVRIAVQNLVKNALDADPSTAAMKITIQRGILSFVITNRTSDMTEENLQRMGEPFFTTKETGKGMGLGVFLSRSIAEQLGGNLKFEWAERQIRAIFSIPLEVPHAT